MTTAFLCAILPAEKDGASGFMERLCVDEAREWTRRTRADSFNDRRW